MYACYTHVFLYLHAQANINTLLYWSKHLVQEIWHKHVDTKTILLDGSVSWNLKRSLLISSTGQRMRHYLVLQSLFAIEGVKLGMRRQILVNFSRVLRDSTPRFVSQSVHWSICHNSIFLVACYATLHLTLRVHRSICRHFTFFNDF